MKITPEIEEKLSELSQKYADSGQDMGSYLDGLLYERYLTYWDYIHLDTLLSLQVPRTYFPDEEIFILYHQITELFFKLILHEQKQLIDNQLKEKELYIQKLGRINNYYRALISSFQIMISGMESDQFMKFRMALLPSSGFQSAQYRMIELYATDLYHLIHPSLRGALKKDASIEELYEHIYWKKGATDITTGNKTLTLKQFEYRYTPRFLRIAKEVKDNTLYQKWLALPNQVKENDELREAFRLFDLNANIYWPLMHLGSAYRYLNRSNSKAVEATGGTNWKAYLPPNFQKIVFFPELWSSKELEEWGKQWVTHPYNLTATK